MRFWGKIFALKSDYYVVEATMDAADDVERPANWEKEGDGINKMIYFVSTNILDPEGWTKLEPIGPDHVKEARRIRYLFTGDLNNKINTYPKFNGLEKHYLKAQIVRISHSTTIIADKMWKIDDGDEELGDMNPNIINREEEQIPAFKYNEMCNLEKWRHWNPIIQKEGRITYTPIEAEDDAVKEQLEKDQKKNDPLEKRLKSIKDDKYLDLDKTWVLRKIGDGTHYTHQFKETEQVHNTVVNIRSLIWPGMNYVCHNDRSIGIYIGNGLKYSSDEFFPRFPYTVLSEPVDRVEECEPDQEELPEEDLEENPENVEEAQAD